VQVIDEPLGGTVSDQPGPGRVRRSHSDELCFENLVSNFTNTLEAASKVLSALLKNPGGQRMYTKRRQDRRSAGVKTSFPLITNDGYLLQRDRRSMPDRRLGNLHLEMIDAVEFGLPDCLTFASPCLTGTED